MRRHLWLVVAVLSVSACASTGGRARPDAKPAASPAESSGSTSRDAILEATRGGAKGAIIGHQMDQQAVELQRVLPAGVVARVGEGIEIGLPTSMLFDGPTDAIRATGARQLRDLAASVQEYPATDLLIIGLVAAGTTDSAARDLMSRRARATFDYLRIHGVKADRMRVAPSGESVRAEQERNSLKSARVQIAIVSNERRPIARP